MGEGSMQLGPRGPNGMGPRGLLLWPRGTPPFGLPASVR